jgi:molybdenum cofactor synthesis domain-containing protein
MIRKVKIEDAVGLTLAHDVTRVSPGTFKGPAFTRGHVIKAEDIPGFLSIGKEHVFILELEGNEVHEEEAAKRIATAVSGKNLRQTEPHEGKVDLVSTLTGFVRINEKGLEKINALGDMIVATMHGNVVCNEGKTIAGMRIIPLFIKDQRLLKMEEIAAKYDPVITVVPFKLKKIGIIVTGNEVFNGTIKDGFSPVLHKKAEALGCTINNETVVPDDSDLIAATIKDFQKKGSEVIICSSGMSVDPDDVTPEGIRKSGAKVAFYGLPVLPGAMSLYAKLDQTHILGAPACVLHSATTGFDLLFPMVLAGIEPTFAETRKLGHGGLCLFCSKCVYPACPFGK